MLIFVLVNSSCSIVFFFFKQKTAYEMRISDWSSDVCSSDLAALKSQLEGRSAADSARNLARAKSELAAIRAIDRETLGEDARLDFDIVTYQQIGRASCRERVCQYV